MEYRMRSLLIVIAGVVSYSVICRGLECWLCIADDCHKPPDGNYMAARRLCDPGQSCQKVYYKSYNPTENKIYESTTRSCSYGPCRSRDDFGNCTYDMLHNPGCVRHECCDDQDLCNAAHAYGGHNSYVFIVCAFIVYFHFYPIQIL